MQHKIKRRETQGNSEIRQGYSVIVYVSNMLLEVLVSTLRQLNEIKGIKIRSDVAKYCDLQNKQ